MTGWTQKFIYGLLAATIPLSSANSMIYTRDADVDPETGLVIAHLEANGGIDWTHHEEGKSATIKDGRWDPAVSAVVASGHSARLARRGQSPNLALRALTSLSKRDDAGWYKDGVAIDGSNKKHHAFFSCYNAGQAQWSNVVSSFAGLGCAALMEGGKAAGLHVWVSNKYWTPDHKYARTFFTIIGFSLDAMSAAQCSWAATYIAQKICQKDVGPGLTKTQGAKMTVYKNEASAWTKGDDLGTFKVDPNTCGVNNIPCDDPPGKPLGQDLSDRSL